ncbi:MAG: HD domain-containing protein [Firmicutes bacterium]|nr:HD domain-containing protein [Bacillota bacterium]
MIKRELYVLLQQKMKPELLQHSLGVKKVACRLASSFGVNPQQAALAGLLHDYGKIYPAELLEKVAREHRLVDSTYIAEKQLLHAPVGAWLVEQELGVTDHEVLEAIRWHTTGSPHLNTLGIIIYVADFCEPGRSFPEAEEVRKFAFQDLTGAALKAVGHTLCFLIKGERQIHPCSWYFYNMLVARQGSRKEEV